MFTTTSEIVDHLSSATENIGLGFRTVTESDAEFLYTMFCDVRLPDLRAAGLAPAAVENLLAIQYRAQAASYRTRFPHALHLVICHQSDPTGHLLLDDCDGSSSLHLVDIALLADWRRRGIGTAILNALKAAAVLRNKPLQLSVASTNPAAALYQRLGFTESGRDQMYISMSWTPNPS